MDNKWREAAANVPEQGTSGYMRFKPGQTKFRILSAPVQGYEFWTRDNKAVRVREYPETVPVAIRPDSKIKFFWAFCVWSFDEKRVQILELTQATIIGQIRDLINAEEWGDPRGYSLTVTRKGEGLETEYGVVPSPAAATPNTVLDAYAKANINLEALFDGGNPFGEEVVPEGRAQDADFV
jgi:hypothetical protein